MQYEVLYSARYNTVICKVEEENIFQDQVSLNIHFKAGVFKYIKIKAREDEQADYYKLFLQKDLITDNSVSYHVKLPANYPGPSGWYSYIYFAIGLDELDDITSISSIYNYNGHNMVFDF